jgi:hypothetical protein
MLFKKLFKLLVVSGALIGGTSGCAARADGSDKKAHSPDAGTAADGGTAKKDTGGGASGW